MAGLLLVGLPLCSTVAGTAAGPLPGALLLPAAGERGGFSGPDSRYPHPGAVPLLLAQAFNQAPSFPDGDPDDRIVVRGASRVLTLRQATDPESDAITYGLRNAPSWMVPDSTSAWEITATPPAGEAPGSRMVGLQATDAGSGGTTEDFFRLEVIDPSEFSGWDLVDGQLVFRFASGWCQGRIARRGVIDVNYGGSKVAGIEPAWEDLDCSMPRPAVQDATIAGSSHMLAYELDAEQLQVSVPLLAAGDHRYEFAVMIQEVLAGGGTAITLELDAAAAALGYKVVDQDFSISELAVEAAAGTSLITLTLSGAGVASSPEWSVYGSPRVSLEVAAVSGSESTEAVVSLGEAAMLDYEATQQFVSVTIVARTGAGEASQQAVFTNLQIMLTNVDEPPAFPVAFPDQRARSGTARSFEFHEAEDPEGDTLEYTHGTLPAGVSFAATATSRTFMVADSVAVGSYAITVTASEQGNSANAAEQSFMLHVGAAGIVADTTSLTPLTQYTRSGTFQVQLEIAPTGNVTVELASALAEQLQVSPATMIFGSGNWNENQEARIELLDAAIEDKSVRNIAITVAVSDEAESDSVYRMAAPALLDVQVSIVNAAPVFHPRQRSRSIFENINDDVYAAGTRVMLPVVATDIDNVERTDLTYMLVGSSALFGVDSETGQITLQVETGFNYEDSDTAGTITIKVADNEPEASRGHATVTVSIGVLDVDEPPVLAELANQYLIAGQGGTYRIPAAVDQDEGQTITYRVASSASAVGELPEGITFDADPESSAFRTFTFASSFTGSVHLWVEAMDSTSLASVRSFFVITRAGGEILPDRDIGELNASGSQRQVTVGLALSLQPDSKGVTLTLSSGNSAMLAIDPVTMEFSASNWNQPQNLVASMTDAALMAKTLQTVAISAAVYQPSTSDGFYQASAGLSIAVELDSVNQPPRFDAEQVATIDLSLDETPGKTALAADTDVGTPINAVIDPDNDAADLTYSIFGSSSEFQIVAASGQLQARSGENFNHERVFGYTLTIQVADGDSGTALATVQVTVNDLPETPENYSGSGFMVAGKNRDSITLQWNNRDFIAQYDPPDRGRIAISYGGGGRRETLDLPAAAVSATLRGLLAGVAYDLTLRWYSEDGISQSAPDASAVISAETTAVNAAPSLVTVSLRRILAEQVGDQPPIAAGAALATVLASDSDGDDIIYSIQGGPDAALFAMDGDRGVISPAAPLSLDYEDKSLYSFAVEAQDNYGGRIRQQFQLTVTNVNEPPHLPDQAARSAVASTATTISIAAAFDPDDPDAGGVKYELVSVDGAVDAPAWLGFTEADGSFVVATAAVAGTYTIAFRAVETGSSALTSPVRSFLLAIAADATNAAPTLAAMFSFGLEENLDYQAGHVVGVVTAADTDVGDILAYRIYGSDAAAFEIIGSPGTISLREGATFDREAKAAYSFVVEVADDNLGIVSAPVVVTIADVNEPPRFPEIPVQRVVQGALATFVIPPALDPEDPEGRMLAYSASNVGPWLSFVGSTRTFTVLPGAPAGLYTLVLAATETGGTDNLVGEQDLVVHVRAAGSLQQLLPAPAFNQAPEFPAGPAADRIVVRGTSKVLTLRQAEDPEGDAISYGLRNAPDWLVQSAVPWKLVASPAAVEIGTRLVLLQATDSGSGGTREDPIVLDIIAPSRFSGWDLVDGRLEFRFASGWCEGQVARRGAFELSYGGSRVIEVEPAWTDLNCISPDLVSRDATIGGDSHRLDYLLERDQLRISVPLLAAGDHQYDLALELDELLAAGGATTTVALASAAAALSYAVVDQDLTMAESASEAAAGTPLVTITLSGAGVAGSPEWSVHGSPQVGLEVAAVSGSESTEAVVELAEAAVLDYEISEQFVSVTIMARTGAAEANQQAVFINLQIVLTDVDEPPVFPAAFPDQRVRSGTAGSFEFHEAIDPEDPEGERGPLVYAPGSLPAGVSFAAGSRVFSVADSVAAGSYAITVTASEQGNSASATEQSFMLHIVAAGVVADTASLTPLSRDARTGTFAVQLGSAPTGNVTLELASSLAGQLQVSPTVMIFGSGNWNESQEVRVELLDEALADKSSRNIDVTVAVRDEAQSDAAYRQAAPAVVPVPVAIVNAAPVFDDGQTRRFIAENFIDEQYDAGDPVNPPLVATDIDNAEFELTYMLKGESDLFGIDADSGLITILMPVNISHEDVSSYTITVEAADNEPEAIRGIAAVTVTITVFDFPEPPILGPLDNLYLLEGQGGTYQLPEAVDQEGGTITYRAAPSEDGSGDLPEGVTFDEDPESPTFRTFTFDPSFSATVQLWAAAIDSTGLVDVQSFVVFVRPHGDVFPLDSISELEVSDQQLRIAVSWVLSIEPDSANVTVTLHSSDDSMLEVEPTTMIFTPANWDVPQEMVASMTEAALAVKARQEILLSVGVHDQENTDTVYRDAIDFQFPVIVDNSNIFPQFDIGQLSGADFSVDETPGRTTLGAAVEIGLPLSVYAFDFDNDADDLSYSIIGESAEFEIDEDSGQLRAKAGAHFNHELSENYAVTLRVFDNDPDFPGNADVLGRVNINDLAEKPFDYRNHGLALAGMTRDAVTIEWNNDEFNAQYDPVDRSRIVLGYGGGGHRVTMELPIDATVAVMRGLVAGVSYSFTLNWYSQDGLTQDTPAVLADVMTSANSAPAFDGDFDAGIDEQVAGQSPAAAGTVLATVAAEDADGDVISYSIQGGDDAGFFAIGEQSGIISLAQTVRFDRERQSSYTFVVQAQDSYGRTVRRPFTVAVNNVNEPPVLPEQLVQRMVVGASLTVTVDPAVDPEGDAFEYDLQVNGGSPPSWLGLDRVNGRITVTDAAPAGTHRLQLKAVETGTSPRLESAVRELVVAVASDTTNTPPRFVSGFRFELREDFEVPSRRTIGTVEAIDDDGDSLTYRIRGDDAALFNIFSPGSGRIELRNRMEFDREEKAEYVFVVEANDGRGGIASVRATLALIEVNEPPYFDEIPDQRAVRGVYSTFVVPPATDPEGDRLLYTVSNPGSWLVFSAATRTFTVLPSAPAGRYMIEITATEAGSTREVDANFVLHIQTAGNQPPEFAQEKVVFELLENRGLEITPAGTSIGTVEASDPDLHPLSYRIAGGTDAAQFEIHPDSGHISLAAALILRAAVKDSYTFMVEADDGNGASARIEVEVIILESSIPKEEKFSLAVADKAIALAATDLISSRMEAVATGARSLDDASLAGDGARLRMASAVEQWGSWRHDDAPGGQRMQLQDFIHERGFDLSLRRARGAEPRFWGAGSRTSQKGSPIVEDVAIPYDGDVDVLMLGVDVGQEWRRLGLAVARSSAQFTVGEESAEIERDLRSLHPYVSWQTTRNIMVWLAAGYGKGDYRRLAAGRIPEIREASHLSLAGGVRGGWEFRGYEFGVGIKATGTRSDLEESRQLLLPESSAESWRAQLDFELARSFDTSANLVMRPFVGGDLRYDSVDTTKSSAIDARAGLRVEWSKALSADVSGRWQVKDDEMSESSFDGSINYDYGADQRGLMLSVVPRLERDHQADGASSLRRVVQTSAKYRMPVRLFKNGGMVEIKSDVSYSNDAQSASYGLGLATRNLQMDLSVSQDTYVLKLQIE